MAETFFLVLVPKWCYPWCLGFFLALMPDSGQVFVKVGGLFGQGGFLPWCLTLVRSSSRLEAYLANVVFALMSDSGQVFVKVGGLFGHRGRFKLPMPVASILKGPVLIFVHWILWRQGWPLSAFYSSVVLLGNYLFILPEDFYIEPASLKTSPPFGVPLWGKEYRLFYIFCVEGKKKIKLKCKWTEGPPLIFCGGCPFYTA